MALSDLLKLHFRASRVDPDAASPDDADEPKVTPLLDRAVVPELEVRDGWPGGSSNGERMSRAIEYVLLQQPAQE